MLNRLAEVQTLDLELDGLQEERGQVPSELLEAKQQRSSLERTIEVRSGLDGSGAVNANELELKSMEERRRNAANAVRASSPKEVSQFQNQELQFGARVQGSSTLPLGELRSGGRGGQRPEG